MIGFGGHSNGFQKLIDQKSQVSLSATITSENTEQTANTNYDRQATGFVVDDSFFNRVNVSLKTP